MADKDYKIVFLARDRSGIINCFHAKPNYDEISGCWMRSERLPPAQGKRRVGTGNDRIFVSLSDDEYPYIKDGECYEFKLIGKLQQK